MNPNKTVPTVFSVVVIVAAVIVLIWLFRVM